MFQLQASEQRKGVETAFVTEKLSFKVTEEIRNNQALNNPALTVTRKTEIAFPSRRRTRAIQERINAQQ